jgi:transcriptional regulator of PTS gene
MMLATIEEDRFDDAGARDRARVFAAVADGAAHSRPEIVDLLGLRSTSTSRTVADLVACRLLVEASGAKLGRGRPAATLAVNPRRIGGSVIHVASRPFVGVLVDLAGRVVRRHVVDVDTSADNDAIARILGSLTERLAGAVPRGMYHAGTVVSVSGVVDIRRRRWLISSRWPRMRGLDIERAIAPGPVDVVRHLDAELRARSVAAPQRFAGGTILLHWGWGIGMAYAVDGQAFDVAGGAFGEIGHWRLDGLDDRRCGCGNTGCLETAAALWSLLPGLRKRWPELPEDEGALAGHLRDLDLLTLPEIREAGRLVARALANLCRILFPMRVIVTSPLLANAPFAAHFGGLFEADGIMEGLTMPELLAEPAGDGFGIGGAAGPLLSRGLEKLLRGAPARPAIPSASGRAVEAEGHRVLRRGTR